MTGLLKSGDGATNRVRSAPLGAWDGAAPTAPLDPTAPLKTKIQRLTRDLADARATIDELKVAADAAYVSGEAQGRLIGLAEAEDQQAARLAALEAGIDRAVGVFDARLDGLEKLAGHLARDGLEKILGDPERHAELLAAAIGEQLKTLARQAVIHIDVPAADFPDSAQLSVLRDALDRPDIEVRPAADLQSGECRINLVLGAVEMGIGQQWRELDAVLQNLDASPELEEGVL